MASQSPVLDSHLKLTSRFLATGRRLQTKIRKEPIGALRFFLFALIWTLALANVVIVVREFQNSLPFVVGLSRRRRRTGIEDSRRQALPVIIAPCITLITVIPIAVGLPLFGIASFLTRYTVEALWTGLVVILTLAGAASLAPQPTSPTLPIRLQNDLSAVLGLSFVIVVLLILYNIILLCRVSFLMGKVGISPMHVAISSLLNNQAAQPTAEKSIPRPEEQIEPLTPEEMARVDEGIEKGSITALSSGWDEEDEEKDKKVPDRQSAFAKAKSIFTST